MPDTAATRRCCWDHPAGTCWPTKRHGCVQYGPLGMGFLLGLATLAAAISASRPWWLDLGAFLLWPMFSLLGQVFL